VTGSSTALSRHGRGIDADRIAVFGLAVAVALPLLVFVALPLFGILKSSFETADGIGFGNYVRYFNSPKFAKVVGNSLSVSLTTTLITVMLAYAFAYAMRRTAMPRKNLFGAVALLPLFAPSLVQALGIVFLLGRNGLINRTFDLDIDIYGFWGIVISDVFYSFPHAYLILSAALAVADARLYESAHVLGATGARIFRDITLPSTKYGVMSATFVVFTIVITDFGNPVVIGGDFNVLATEIYNQVSGQGNFAMGAVIGVILLLPRRTRRPRGEMDHAAAPCVDHGALAAAQDRTRPLARSARPWLCECRLRHDRGRRRRGVRRELRYVVAVQHAFEPAPLPVRGAERPRAAVDQHLGFTAGRAHRRHRDHRRRVRRACIAWAAGAIALFPVDPAGGGAGNGAGSRLYPGVQRSQEPAGAAVRHVPHPRDLQRLPLSRAGIPDRDDQHQQISRVFDEASTSLGGSFLRTLWAVTLPIISPSIISVGVFYFVRSMVTLSAVIFLVTPVTQLAAVSVLLLDDSGNQNQAAAFSVCIMLVVAAALVAFRGALRLSGRKDVALMR
jgi:ABC-type spermidine/putrescine transport system permease subunit I